MMLTLKAASELTGCSYFFLRNLCLCGKVKYVRSGVKYLINKKSLLAYLGEGAENE